jgi:hypothetical protein
MPREYFCFARYNAKNVSIINATINYYKNNAQTSNILYKAR